MKKDFTETIRINTLDNILMYDTCQPKNHCYISIGHVNNRYGILREDGTEFLSFKYDNITIWGGGIGLFQLSLNGKLGLLHIRKKTEGNDFYIARLIDCEYDVIQDSNEEGSVFLWKYGLHTDYFHGRSVRVYLPKPEMLTEECETVGIMNIADESRWLCLRQNGCESIVNIETGKDLVDESDDFTFRGYETENAVVLQQEHNGNSRLLYLGKDETKEFGFDGKNAYALTGMNADGDLQTVGFVVEHEHGFMLLDDELCLLAESDFALFRFIVK